MTHLQLHLANPRHQELRCSPFCPTPLFWSQLVQEGEEFLLKQAPLKILKALDPIKSSPFMVPTIIKKDPPTENTPMDGNPLQAVSNHFPQAGGYRVTETPKVVFDLTQGDAGVKTPPPNVSLKASLNPPVGGCLGSFRRDWQTEECSNNMLNILTNGYVLPFITKPNLTRVPLIHSDTRAIKRSSSGLLYPVSSVKKPEV